MSWNGQTVDRPRYVGWTLGAGAIFGVTALLSAPLLGLEISSDLGNEGGHVTWVTLFVGVFVTGALMWWLLLARPLRFSAVRGAATGVLVACLSYPVVIALSEITQRNWLAPPPLGERLDSVLLVAGLTLLTTGFAAALIMAAVGAAGTLLLVHSHPATAAIVGRNGSSLDRPRRLRMVATVTLATLVVVGLAASYAWFSSRPLATAPLGRHEALSAPAQSYAEALAMFRTIEAEESGLPLHELCRSTLLTHGRKVARTVIYFHGFTSCPAQGDKLAASLFDMGYNVYLPRMTGHGAAVPTAQDMAQLRGGDLIELATESVDLAQGLGEEVVVIGLSAGGTIATWTAQYRPDVDHAIAVSPFFGPYVVPPRAMHAATNLTLQLPNLVFAWNPLQNVAGDFPISLPATHALAEIMLTGWQVRDGARAGPPAAARVSFVLNEADVAVSNILTDEIIAYWRGHGAEVTVEILPFSHYLPHDIINHRERGANVDLVHGLLIELMNAD